jgi:hypothetical protein
MRPAEAGVPAVAATAGTIDVDEIEKRLSSRRGPSLARIARKLKPAVATRASAGAADVLYTP